MENPFIYGESVCDSAFCNRKDEIAELLRDIKSSQNVIVFSPRRYGKTSLIQTVINKAIKRNLVCIYVDLYPAITEADFANLLAKAVASSIEGTTDKILKWFRDNLLKLRPKIVLEEDGTTGFTFAIDNRSDAVPHINSILSAVHNYLKKSKKKGVVVFDEFQQINQFANNKLEKQLRTVIQNHRDISYIFMGSKRHLIFEMFSNPNKPFYRSAKHFPIDKISPRELTTFIRNRFKETGKKIENEIIDRILTISGCHPYYVQFICHIVWEKVDSKGFVDIDEIIHTALTRESIAFQNTWDLLTMAQRQALVAIAHKTEADKLFSADFLSRFGLSSASAFQKTLNTLMQKDILDKENGNWNIPDVLFDLWVRQQK